jgi:hypothetical protein
MDDSDLKAPAKVRPASIIGADVHFTCTATTHERGATTLKYYRYQTPRAENHNPGISNNHIKMVYMATTTMYVQTVSRMRELRLTFINFTRKRKESRECKLYVEDGRDQLCSNSGETFRGEKIGASHRVTG